MKKLLSLFFFMIFSANLYAADFRGRSPVATIDGDPYSDFEIMKSGHYYLTVNGGIYNINSLKTATPEFAAALTFGANFHKYIGTEVIGIFENYVYKAGGLNEKMMSMNITGLITLRYAFRVNYTFSIIPYVAAGINVGMMIVPGQSVLLPLDMRLLNEYNGLQSTFLPTFGFSVKAGLRFKADHFLIGLGMQYNFSYLDFTMKNPNFFVEIGGTF